MADLDSLSDEIGKVLAKPIERAHDLHGLSARRWLPRGICHLAFAHEARRCPTSQRIGREHRHECSECVGFSEPVRLEKGRAVAKDFLAELSSTDDDVRCWSALSLSRRCSHLWLRSRRFLNVGVTRTRLAAIAV